ncbi:MAG: RagB/SusD family nutrient uptake outer membrane protein [Prevotella sp.]|nr:RagB/SusD family nutrient uptake outer membrane protein [Prevotella sp.]
MKLRDFKLIIPVFIAVMGFTACNSFLDQPATDNYNADNFYQNDDQCIEGVNYLYNSPWYDFQRGFIKVGEVLSGNYMWPNSPYLTFTVNSTDEDLVNMSYSLWAVIGHANTVYDNLKKASGPSEAIKNQCMGEALTWKAMAYFYLVRTFGDVPIVHDNSTSIGNQEYSTMRKVQKSDVYDYIIMTLEQAMTDLKGVKTPGNGRIDYYSAEGLLAKVYLTKSGVSASGKGQRNTDDLAKAASYAKDVIDNSGRNLLDNYSDNFRLANNNNQESLIAWKWIVSNQWTSQNTLQSDLAMVGFDEYGDCWGGYGGPSVDLQDAFGVSALQSPELRSDLDARRKATMMMAGDFYDYFWTDKTDKNGKKGFNYLQFIYDKDYGAGGPNGQYQSPTGANDVKQLYGDDADHIAGVGTSAANMASSLSTHILRLSDIYLIYTEAVIGNNGSTTDASAIDAFYKVRHRSVPSYKRPASVSWTDVWKERRLEFAMEGDHWYDFVRRSYFDMDGAIQELKSQRRNQYYNLGDVYQRYYESGIWSVDTTLTRYNTDTPVPNVTASSFTLPFPQNDVVIDPSLNDSPIHVDVRKTYSY